MNRMLRFLFLASFCGTVAPLGVAAALTSVDASASAPAGETARKSDDLVNFVGVNANFSGTDANWQRTLAALRTLGVRHVRDGVVTGGSEVFFDRHTTVGAMGVKSIFTAAHGTSVSALERFAGRVSSDIEGLEAPSDLDASSDPSWVRDLRSDVIAVHTSAKALGVLSVGPTMASAVSYSSLGNLSGLEDYAGVGSLPCVDEQSASTCASVKQMEASLTGQPFVVTGTTPSTASQLPPAVAALYLPRVLLEEWNAGAKRTYRADLEVASTSDFALLDQNGAETPAFRALSGLVSLLTDGSSGTFQPGSLAYRVSGVDSSVHHALFQKSDGSFYLALWIDAPSYDPNTRKMLTVPGQVAKLETAEPMGMTTYEFDETGHVTGSTATLSTPQMVPVSDRMLVIKLTPESTDTATTTAAAGATASTSTTAAATVNVLAAASATTASSDVTSMSNSTLLKTADATTNGGATYYVSSSTGNDDNDGLSTAKPWKTIGKVNANTKLYKPGTSILLKRGDTFRDDYLRILNEINAGPTTSFDNTPLPVAGTAAQPIILGAYGTGANPLLDGADPLKVTWTRVTSTTWKATVASLPSKMFVDSLTAETVQLTPQPNAVGTWKANTAYKYLDLVMYKGSKYVVVGVAGTIPTPSLPYGQPYLGISNPAAGNSSQTFSGTNSGLTNVQNTPGSWYGTGTTVYVHLADGSDPNAHVIEGSYRPYGVLLMSVNYVTVQDLTVERPQMMGIAMGTWTDNSLAGHYKTNEYNSVLNTQVWNWGNLGNGCMTQRHRCGYSGQAGIVSQAYGNVATGGTALAGTVISGNYVGRSDQYFAIRSMVQNAGIEAIGQNGAVISNNRIVTVNNQCLNYNVQMNAPLNVGGDIGYNYCGNNQGNFFFGTTTGGRLHHNIAANSYGEGIQIGGNDYGGMVDHNLLYNLGMMASTVGYNGIDCNGTGSYMTLANNTIVNVYAAAITLETGCDHAYVVNNVLDVPLSNSGAFYYYLPASFATATFRNNLYSETSGVHPWRYNYLLAQWKVVSGETDAVQANPVFVDAGAGDYRLASNSLGINSALTVTGDTPGTSAADSGGANDQGANLSAAGLQ